MRGMRRTRPDADGGRLAARMVNHDKPGRSRRLNAAPIIETMESRLLLTVGFGRYHLIDPAHVRTIEHEGPAVRVTPRFKPSEASLLQLDADGKIIRGQDRDGDTYVITVHGPGTIIVTDVTPYDGVLNDDIDTIQLVGTDLRRTVITGQTTASSFPKSAGNTNEPSFRHSDGVVFFNRLVGETGAHSIILNGFSLARTRTPGAELNVDPEIFLPGGVNTLSFNNIEATIDQANLGTPTAALAKPFQVVIGDPTTPLVHTHPRIKLNAIRNTVFNSNEFAARQTQPLRNDPTGQFARSQRILPPPTAPRVDPTVEFLVNAPVRSFEATSITRAPRENAAENIQFTKVGTTGRTALRTPAAGRIKVNGETHNVTVSRSARPFEDGFTGMSRLAHAKFGGNADGLGLDVNGPIGSLTFARGLGSPVDNRANSPVSTARVASNFGRPDFDRGYPAAVELVNPGVPNSFPRDPATGGFGGLVTATTIGRLRADAAETKGLLGVDPASAQTQTTGVTSYVPRPGNALTAAAILAQRAVGGGVITGDLSNSEIAGGFDYVSFVDGLEANRAPGSVGPLHIPRGDLIDSVVSATYDPGANQVFGRTTQFGPTDDLKGPGSIHAHQRGRAIQFGEKGNTVPTVLGRQGTGFFAVKRSPGLEPPERPSRFHGVLRR